MSFRRRVLPALAGAILVFGAALANEAVICDLISYPVSLRTLVLIASLFALIAAVVLLTPKPVPVLSVPTVLIALLFFFCRDEVAEEVRTLRLCLTRSPALNNLLSLLPGAEGDGGSSLWETGEGFWFPLFAAFFWATLLILILSAGKYCFWYTAFDTVLLCVSAGFMNSFPSGPAIVLFASVHVLINLTSLLLARDRTRSAAAALALTVPAALLCITCYAPLSIYERPAFTDRVVARSVELWRDFTNARKQRAAGNTGNGEGNGTAPSEWVPPSAEIGAFSWNSSVDLVELNEVGPRESIDEPVMEVYSDRARTLYLRGVSYAVYGPDSWSQFSENTIAAYAGIFSKSLFTTDVSPLEEIRIRNAHASDLLWLPYTPTELPSQTVSVGDSYVAAGTNRWFAYSYNVLIYPNAAFAPVSWSYYQFVFSEYLYVPPETRAMLDGIVSRFDPSDPNLVYKVADYVRNSAEYDVDTPAMPEDEDFVPWFLYQSDRGYCVHFASAAAVLLRCLGVPARYVTGYMIKTDGGEWAPVTDNDAHAWVEYFDDSMASWRMLEVTPSLGGPEEEEEETEASGPAAPLPNLHEETEAVTETTPERPRTEPAPVVRTRRVPVLRIGLPAVVLLFLVLWPVVRSGRRKASLSRGTPGERAVRAYRLIGRYEAASGVPLAEADRKQANDIALKARFSLHETPPEELLFMEDQLSRVMSGLRRGGKLPRRLWNRWFYGV